MNYRDQVKRMELLHRARMLARSGELADSAGVEEMLRPIDGWQHIAHWFADPRFRAQLDRLCEMARAKKARTGRPDPDAAPLKGACTPDVGTSNHGIMAD